MKSYIVGLSLVLFVWACANDKKDNMREQSIQTVSQDAQRPVQTVPNQTPVQQQTAPASNIPDQAKEAAKNLKPNANNQSSEPIFIRGVNLTYPVSQSMARQGKFTFDNRCANCHSLGTSVIKAAGLGGITKRRKPDWIMNMTTGVTTNLDNDPAVNSKLQACPTRQKDTRLDIVDSRNILEFFRMNDGEKTD